MVAIRSRASEGASLWQKWLCFAGLLVVSTTALYLLIPNDETGTVSRLPQSNPKPQVAFLDTSSRSNNQQQRMCPYMSLSDLSEDELHPRQGHRHMVTPPMGGNLTLVCCRTTQGPWNLLVHTKWAPHGANRFLAMVRSHYFRSTVPLMRCVKKFLCQFGLNGDPQVTKQYNKNLPDDPPWLPLGPTYRENSNHVKRFAKGYLAYAGGGPATRSNQFIVALKPNGPLAGGSPWEVPWGELVGDHSFATLDKIYTGYGEDGPPQGILHKEGASEDVQAKWPELDYITSCEVVDEHIEQP